MMYDTEFNFGGRWSYDMGVIKVKLDNGLFEDPIVASKTIKEEKIEGRKRPYFYGVDYSPITFPLDIYFENNLSEEKIREVLRWLNTDKYERFYMNSSPDRVWYAMIINDITSIHNGIRDGYMRLNMRTDNSNALTPFSSSRVHTFVNNSDGETIDFINEGDFSCKPIINIVKRGQGDVTIKNLNNYTGDFKFTGLNDGEKLMIDCENKEIETSEPTYRYDDFSGNYLELARGYNRISVDGDCDLWFDTEFDIY
ncbi:phage tail domain-containing protein [Paraliobacillus ryukyuensis]|uniref:phage tail domain-containing protein n=1 Tax=Paraliobacillus ryukyuensis TaxID=200904 RepID=UPI0009A65947|nr:phage tail domain-containing protein [Paraliobacillus ryukyuensis]